MYQKKFLLHLYPAKGCMILTREMIIIAITFSFEQKCFVMKLNSNVIMQNFLVRMKRSRVLEFLKIFFSFLTFLVLFSCSSNNSTIEPVSFEKPWDSPYRVSTTYKHQLVNKNGNFLYILNKTAWAYFLCEYPDKVLENAKKHGANVIRVCLEGTPYEDSLHYDLWPWGGTRNNPDFSTFNLPYWQQVEERIKLAGEHGIGFDIVLYFDFKPTIDDLAVQKKYCDMVLKRLSKYSNILTWEIMNEEISNELFQDSIATYIKNNDPYKHLIISSDGTADDALWPHKEWMSMAIVHTCTGNQPDYDLENWYLNIAKNIRQYGKPAFNNESGREKRHKNDDPIHRRKQGWLFSNAGCFWTWHSWDGCEGINDTTYFADGWQYLKPMKNYYESIPFWKLEPTYTVCILKECDLIFSTMSSPERDTSVMYCCTKQTHQMVENAKVYLRIKNGLYTLRFIKPENLELIDQMEFVSEGLKNQYEIKLPTFMDDLIIEITVKGRIEEKTLIEGTL